MTNRIKIIIADDVPILTEALKDKLEESDDFQVIKTFNTLEDLIAALPAMTFDILLLDINFNGVSSLEHVQKLYSNFSDFQILCLTTLDNNYQRQKALEKGIVHFEEKSISANNLKERLRTMIQDKKRKNVSLPSFKKATIDGATLTKIKIIVLQALYNHSEQNETFIAQKLGIKESTLKTHKRELFEITNTRKVTDLIKYGIKKGIIIP